MIASLFVFVSNEKVYFPPDTKNSVADDHSLEYTIAFVVFLNL